MKKKMIVGIIILISIIIISPKKTITSYAETSSMVNEIEKPLVCLVGQDYSNYLEYSGYEIIDNPVNFSICNRYHVKYQKGDQIYDKIVEVVNKDTLMNLGYYQFNYQDFLPNTNDGQALFTRTNVNGLEYLIYGLFNQNNLNEEYDTYLAVYDGDATVLVKNIYQKSKKIPEKIVISENFITILGQNENGDIYMENYDHSGTLKCENVLIGENSDNLMDAVVVENYLFIVGSSDSADHLYLGTRNGIDGFVMRINLDTLTYSSLYFFSKNGYDYVSQICTDGSDLYLVHQFTMSNNTPYAILYKMSQDLGLLKQLTISTEIDFELVDLEIYYNNIYVLNNVYSYNHERKIGHLGIYNNAFRVIKHLYYEDEDFNKVAGISFNNEGFSTLLITKNENDEYGIRTINYLNMEEVSRLGSIVEGSHFAKPAGVDGNQAYININNKIKKLVITNVNVKSFGNFEKEQLVNDEVYINNKKIKLNTSLSKISYNEEVFGNYRLICGFVADELNLLYYLDHIVVEDFNVKINETYDKGYILAFNGTGYLNGILIENGHVIDQDGLYTLEVYGNNNIKREINFQIREYKLEYQISKVNQINDYNVTLGNQDINEEISYSVQTNDKNQINYPTRNYWLLILPILSSISVALIVIRFH